MHAEDGVGCISLVRLNGQREEKEQETEPRRRVIGTVLQAFGKTLKLSLVAGCTIMARLTRASATEESGQAGEILKQTTARCLCRLSPTDNKCGRVWRLGVSRGGPRLAGLTPGCCEDVGYGVQRQRAGA